MKAKKDELLAQAHFAQIVGTIIVIVAVFVEALPLGVVGCLPMFVGFYREYKLRKRYRY